MAGRRFEVADGSAVLQHWQAGRSRRQLARSFGMLGRWEDRLNERTRKVWGFVMVLPFSRMTFVWPVLICDQSAGWRRTWPPSVSSGRRRGRSGSTT
jgi:hypothetical protein